MCLNKCCVSAGEVGDTENRGKEISVIVEGDVGVSESPYRERTNVTITFVGEGRRVANIVSNPNRSFNHINV